MVTDSRCVFFIFTSHFGRNKKKGKKKKEKKPEPDYT